MNRGLTAALSVVMVITLLGAGGYLYWKLHLREQETAQRLEESQASLGKTQGSLSTLQEEHQRLSQDYDTLNGRWKATEEQLEQVKREAERLSTQLTALTTERTDLKRQVADGVREETRLQGQLKMTEQQIASSQAERAVLEAALSETAARAITPEELRQLAGTIAAQREEHARLQGRVEKLSQAYEQLARTGSPTQQAEVAVGQPTSPARSSPEEIRSARLYRDLGDAYLATTRYAEAAGMFEQSLTLKEDPEVHSRLAFLYGRLLHDPVRAARHAARSSNHDDVTAGLAAASRADGLPRKNTRLVWRWLTQ